MSRIYIRGECMCFFFSSSSPTFLPKWRTSLSRITSNGATRGSVKAFFYADRQQQRNESTSGDLFFFFHRRNREPPTGTCRVHFLLPFSQYTAPDRMSAMLSLLSLKQKPRPHYTSPRIGEPNDKARQYFALRLNTQRYA